MAADEQREELEYLKCSQAPAYFIYEYCQIEEPSPDVRDWIPFRLWPAQFEVLNDLLAHRLLVILKARQLGLTWLVVAYALWLMLFRPGSVILLFSMGEGEAYELMDRLRDMHELLPDFLQASIGTSNAGEYEFAKLNSRALSFPSTKKAGRGYTATLVIMDEADFHAWLKQAITATKPTIDAGGQLILLSTSDTERPESLFKSIYKKARDGENGYHPIFLDAFARPDRTPEWYARTKAESDDPEDFRQEYPLTDTEALAGRQSRKRFRPEPLDDCYEPADALDTGPDIPGLTVYNQPREWHHSYLIAVDTSEGDLTSDPAAVTVFEIESWDEVAHMHGLYEIEVLAGYLVSLADYYRGLQPAVITVERNNHGHAVHVALHERPGDYQIYVSPFDGKEGWLTSPKTKPQMVSMTAEALKAGDPTIRTEATKYELADLESATLKAPEGRTDDRAMSFMIGLAALHWPSDHKGKPAAGQIARPR